MPRIASPDNPRLKQAVRLIASSRDRRKAGLCVLEGAHLVSVYVERHGAPETVIVLDSAAENPALRVLLASVPPSRALTVSASAWAAFSQLPVDVAMLAGVPTPHPTRGRVPD